MQFGRTPVANAAGGILAHSVKYSSINLKKGAVLSTEDIRLLARAGCESVVIARLEETDLDENEAARRIAVCISGENTGSQRPSAGRSNIISRVPGVLVYEAAELDRFNLVSEAVTIAALPPYSVVASGQAVATIKIIPYGVDEQIIRRIEQMHPHLPPLLRATVFNELDIGLVQTFYQGMKQTILDKTRKILDERLRRLGSSKVIVEERCEHHEDAITDAFNKLLEGGCNIILIAGASATADRRDVIPLAIEAAGGGITHLGMPVEPGNLLVLGEFPDERPVIVMPGCARSPAVNGFDWVLERLLAGLPITREDIMLMGAGGYIK
ncbi:MAG: molybdopterin-binding protein [Gammaproteobacteria bacterium]|nr:molybdopterin-binding protein [Gammaproteobacteria bacterium]